MASVELRNIVKRFGGNTVIDNLSLTVASGEFLVILGPSGCGKSTLLRMIAGLETIDGGEIRIGDERVDTLPPGERGVAMVFQHYALYPHMSVRENMAFGLRNVGVDKAEIGRRIENAAAMLEIGQLLDRRPTQLSGGQRQRVAIGRAIVKEPRLFLFDEPLSNLDAALRGRTRVELARLHQRMASTMVFVTHDQIEAMTLADRIVLMNAQKIEQIGTPMEIYDRPATEFVACFVGTPKINLIPVSIAADGMRPLTLTLGDGAKITAGFNPARLPSTTSYRLGVRAEQIMVTAPEAGDTRGQVEVVERLGDRTLLYVKLADGTSVVAEDAAASRAVEGDAVGLGFRNARLHLFEENGRAHHADSLEPAAACHA
ncbi:ABC transporter ATP-binding protein [Pedomonas mirosovicensis]|uniref:ABC transporter ATP-binding protein n=1 Tax=Pedomonas mirosovicensis TaxID=2908641 RepID=UPI0021670C04|nr:sn-glycerol-3-phosphate ABC transporter ATP-binding protein UgpC [Pedomonas mirosovicensis]MCH8686794.1 sn-glycerol-3-phosphate ABC transporter ATP-binding protein UgpC [Pedomonas mirosovicensis]